MSTGLNCEFIEPVQGKWFYILQDSFAPKIEWDWREHATCYGPFDSEEMANEHLRNNHANPGGSFTMGHDAFQLDETYLRLIVKAIGGVW